MKTNADRVHTIGERVMYTKAFLKSICTGPCDDLWRMKGTVTDLHSWGDGRVWPIILWDGDAESRMVHANNVESGLSAHID